MQGAQRGLEVGLGDHAGDPDLRGRDHLDVDAGIGQRPEHPGRVARGVVQPGADDRHLGDRRVGRQLAGAELAHERIEGLLGRRELDPRDREREVGRAAVADVLDDHVDVDAGLGERVEDRPRDARPVRHGDDRDLGDVPVVGEPADLVALLHERVLLDERAGGVLERAEDLDDDVVDPAQLDRPDLHDLGALVGELEHLLVADDRELARLGDESRVGRVDALDVGEDLAAVGARLAARATAVVSLPPRPSVVISALSTADALWPWKPATMTTLPAASSARTRRGSMPAMRARP